MKKRLFTLSLAVVALFAFCVIPAAAASDAPAISLTVDGAPYTFDETLGVPFVDDNGVVMLPLRSTVYALGIEEENVVWNAEKRTVSLITADRTLVFTMGLSSCKITKGETTTYMLMDSAPVLQGGRTYLPASYVAAAMDYQASWDEETATVSISTTAVVDNQVNIYLTRHGKTLFNTVGRVQGWSDTPLTAAGAKVAADLGKGLTASGISFMAAYSSDLGRQRETARIVLDEMGLTEIPVQELLGLRESCFGSWEGELESVRDAYYCEQVGCHSIYEIYEMGSVFSDITLASDTTGMAESDAQVEARMMEALKIIGAEAAAAGGGNVLVVSSGGAITTTLAAHTGIGANLKNASVTYLTYRDGVFFLGVVGDMYYANLGATI